jgi:hypothetical protein
MAKKKIIKNKSKRADGKKWFKTISSKHNWGFIPVNWEGWVSLILLLVVNIFSANYFNLRILVFDSWSKFGVVFFISLFVFIMISKRKTKNGKKK